MATTLIETNSLYDSQIWRQDLGGQSYQFKLIWNARSSVWQFEMYDPNGDLIASSPLVLGCPIFADYTILEGVPPGTFVLVNLAKDGQEFTRYDLGNTVQLFYVEA